MYKTYYNTKCDVFGCNSNTVEEPGLSYFSVPKDPNMRTIWLEKIQRIDKNCDVSTLSTTIFVCEKHFEKKYIKDNFMRKRLLTRAIPTLYLPTKETGYWRLDESVACTSGTTIIRHHEEPKQYQVENFIRIKEEPECLTVFEDEQEEVKPVFEEVFAPKEVDVPVVEDVPMLHDQKRKPTKPNKQRYSHEFKMAALNLYFTSPFSYRAFQSSFRLPQLSTLYRLCIPVTTHLNHDVLAALKLKAGGMTQAQKQCVVCVGSTTLTPNVYYDVKADKIAGFHEVDGVQILEPARTALVIIVRGLFHNWKQVAGFIFLSNSQNCEDTKRYIMTIIAKLFDVGLNVRVFLTDLETEKFTGSLSLDPQNPLMTVGGNKIFYAYDFLYLMRNIRDHLMTHNFVFHTGLVAKWQDIKKCYNYDLRRRLRLVPKLTQNHIVPAKDALDDLKNTVELFDKTTATAIAIFVDMKVLDASALHTVQWIVKMNKLMEMLNFSTMNPPAEKGNVFFGDASQVDFLVAMISLFSGLSFKPTSTSSEKNSPTFVETARMTINAIMLLYGDLKTEKCWYPIVGISRDCLDDFFHKVRQECGGCNPTTLAMVKCMTNFPIFNIFPYFCKKRRPNDLETFMSLIRQMSVITKYEQGSDKVHEDACADEMEEFSKVLLQKKNGQLALYLLNKAYQQHSNCGNMKIYVYGPKDVDYDVRKVRGARFRSNVGGTDNIPVIFIEFIETLELKFKDYFKQNIGPLSLAALESFMKNIEFEMPCKCFPVDYVKKLYLRIRFYLLLEYNSKLFKNKSCNTIVVNELW